MRKPWPVILLVLGLMLGAAACGGEDEPSPTATASPAPTETESGSVLPPTWTPIPEGFVATEAPAEAAATRVTAPAATPLSGGQQLPPTWTPLPDDFIPPRATATPLQPLISQEGVPTIGGTPVPNPPTWTPYPAECEQFDILTSPERVILGNPAGIGWSPLPGAAGYEVVVRHRGGGVLLDEVTESTLFEIPAETFFEQGPYGWEVIPLNRDGLQLCGSRGDELYVYALN